MVNLKLSWWSIPAFYQRQAQKVINNLTTPMLNYAKQISPTDTWEYIDSREKIPTTSINWTVSWWIVNDSPHNLIIESWVKGRKYNYHKWPPRNSSTVIYSGVWNRTGQRTLDNIEKDFINESKKIWKL